MVHHIRGARALAALCLTLGASWSLGQQANAEETTSAEIEALDLSELLDTRISSVSRREERTALAPAAVFVLTGEDLRRQGFRTLDEALRSVPGLFVTDDKLYPVAGVRGIAPLGDLTTRLLVLVDGHPLNNSVGIGQSYLERDLPVELSLVDRVEVIKGPVGSVYGPVAFFGVINVVTRTAAGAAHKAEVNVGGEVADASANAGDLGASYLGSAGELSWSLNVGLRRSNGLTYAFPELIGADRDLPAGGIVEGADRQWSQNAYGTVRYGDVSLNLGWSQRHRNLPTAPYSTLIGDPRSFMYNRTGFAQLSWSRKPTAITELYARLSYDDFRYGDDLAYADPPDDEGLFFDLGQDRWLSAEGRVTLTPFAGHRDLLGVEVQGHSTLQRAQYYGLDPITVDPDNGFGVGDIARNFGTVNAYLLVEQLLLEDRLLLQGGLTFYSHSLFGFRVTPKVAAVYRLSDDDTVKAMYAEGFRPPTMFEAFFEDGLDFLANPALRPEVARSLELGYERRFEQVATAGVSLYGAQYARQIQSLVVPIVENPDPDDPAHWRSQYANAGEMFAVGADAYATVRIKRWLQAYGGVSGQLLLGFDPESASDANFAPVTANLALSSNAAWDPLWLSLNAAFVSERRKDPATVVLPGDRESVPGYVLLNASARLEAPWVKGLSAQLTLYNLLDAQVVDPLTVDHAPLSEIRQPGRSFRLDLEYRF